MTSNYDRDKKWGNCAGKENSQNGVNIAKFSVNFLVEQNRVDVNSFLSNLSCTGNLWIGEFKYKSNFFFYPQLWIIPAYLDPKGHSSEQYLYSCID